MPHDAFVFVGYRWDPATATLSLRYRYPEGPAFEERLVFDVPRRPLGTHEAELLERLFRLIFLVSGVSYYKAFVPRELYCEAFPIEPPTAAFLTRFYELGLAEFAYQNRLSLKGHLRFRSAAVAAPAPLAVELPRRSCVPVGGGKDSIVTIEWLRAMGEPLLLFALGDAAPIAATIAAAGLPAIRVIRHLDPALFALNRAGALNGHVPITGILSAIALAAAVLAGCDAVVMSNEHSASAPNLVFDRTPINHQYSKSFEFEQDLSDYLARHLSPNLAYFSLLRPLSEIAIARRFARHPGYFPVFRSCNAAFRQDPAARGEQWCGACAKCRFVFLALAPFLAKADLVRIFGRDLLDDEEQLEGFAALCGLADHKPFECVGEIAESAAVMAHLAGSADWREDRVVRRLNRDFPSLREADYPALFDKREPHRVPARYLAMLDAGC
jgi:UDP-N-acetyl-alpha-D-muramoyl-L-alanyl-L-glutamate epimerase